MTHEGRKIKIDKISYPLQNFHITMICIKSREGGGIKKKTKKKNKRKWGHL